MCVSIHRTSTTAGAGATAVATVTTKTADDPSADAMIHPAESDPLAPEGPTHAGAAAVGHRNACRHMTAAEGAACPHRAIAGASMIGDGPRPLGSADGRRKRTADGTALATVVGEVRRRDGADLAQAAALRAAHRPIRTRISALVILFIDLMGLATSLSPPRRPHQPKQTLEQRFPTTQSAAETVSKVSPRWRCGRAVGWNALGQISRLHL